MECSWRISKACHKTKKSSFVCGACWKEADEKKRETYKDLEEGWCVVVGCWHREVNNTGLCTRHKRERSRSARPSLTPLLPATSKAPPPARVWEPMLKLRSEDITEIVREGVQELYRRTQGP